MAAPILADQACALLAAREGLTQKQKTMTAWSDRPSPEGEGFQPSPNETVKYRAALDFTYE